MLQTEPNERSNGALDASVVKKTCWQRATARFVQFSVWGSLDSRFWVPRSLDSRGDIWIHVFGSGHLWMHVFWSRDVLIPGSWPRDLWIHGCGSEDLSIHVFVGPEIFGFTIMICSCFYPPQLIRVLSFRCSIFANIFDFRKN